MTYRRSNAPVQIDPYRARLGKPAAARDVLCPNCGVAFATQRRWQVRCPECDHRWIDRSSRTFLDKLRDARGDFVMTLVFSASVLLGAGLLLVWIGWLFAEAAGMRGWERTWGLAALFAAAFASLLVLGWLLQHWGRSAQRPPK
jgi:DNA-directed RNA polymerase subunit RPC12/RpoP